MAIPARLKSFHSIVVIVLIVLALVVAWQNSAPSALYFLGFRAELPLMVWLGLFLAIGFILGVSLMWSYRRRTSMGRQGTQ
jgi:uncharacterized integral membrane protein